MLLMHPVILRHVAFAEEKNRSFSSTLGSEKSIFQGDKYQFFSAKEKKGIVYYV